MGLQGKWGKGSLPETGKDRRPEAGQCPAGGGPGKLALGEPERTAAIATIEGHEIEIAAAAVFVQDPHATPMLPGEAFAKLYGLTASELRVVLAMAPGLQPGDAADLLGGSHATVKSNLSRVFAKTGTSRQAGRMALIGRLSGPVGAGGISHTLLRKGHYHAPTRRSQLWLASAQHLNGR